MNTTNIHSDIAAARAKLDAVSAELRALEERAKTPAPWEPKGGDYYLRADGIVDHCPVNGTPESRIAGTDYPTREAAESALPYVTFFKRLCCLAQELNPSGEIGGQYRVYFAFAKWKANTGTDQRDPWDLFETRDAATRAAEILNRDKWAVPSL